MESDLIANGIMTVSPRKKFSEIIGCHQILTPPQSHDDSSQDPATQHTILPPCLNDLKSLLIVHGAMPIKSAEICEALDSRVRSILLVGPRASSKRSLLYALCHEMRATVFDLSCDNLVGKYVGPDSVGQYGVENIPGAKKHQEQFMYTVMKVAKVNQPAVILINEADTMFYKKVPKELADAEPKRLKKDWPKIIKKISNSRPHSSPRYCFGAIRGRPKKPRKTL